MASIIVVTSLKSKYVGSKVVGRLVGKLVGLKMNIKQCITLNDLHNTKQPIHSHLHVRLSQNSKININSFCLVYIK